MHFHRREDVKEILLASWLQPFVQASFASSFPCHAPQRIQHEDLHSLIILRKTIAFWILWHYYRVCTLLISSNPVTFHDFFHDHKFRVFLTLFSSTNTNSSVQQNACHSHCLITSLYCTLSLLWHHSAITNLPNMTFHSMTFQAWKVKSLNFMTFQVFHDMYKPSYIWGVFLPHLFMFWPFGNILYTQWIFFLLRKLLAVSGEKWWFVSAV